jgi:UDP-galactopyranose mutase
VWDFVQNFAQFNNYINCPVARYKDELYNLPFNMNTFSKMWNIQTPAQAMEIIEKQRKEAAVENPSNLEEQALSLAGRDVYTKLIKGYTEAVGQRLQGTAFLHYQKTAFPVHL